MQYLVGGHNGAGRVNLSRDTAAAALKKARELLQEGYMDVRICARPDPVPDEFDKLEA